MPVPAILKYGVGNIPHKLRISKARNLYLLAQEVFNPSLKEKEIRVHCAKLDVRKGKVVADTITETRLSLSVDHMHWLLHNGDSILNAARNGISYTNNIASTCVSVVKSIVTIKRELQNAAMITNPKKNEIILSIGEFAKLLEAGRSKILPIAREMEITLEGSIPVHMVESSDEDDDIEDVLMRPKSKHMSVIGKGETSTKRKRKAIFDSDSEDDASKPPSRKDTLIIDADDEHTLM